MEVASGLSARPNSISNTLHTKEDEKGSPDMENLELETMIPSHRMNSLDILRESVRILRYSSSTLLSIAVVLICPVSAIFLSNILVNRALVKWLSAQLLLIAGSNGLPLDPFVKLSCRKLSEMAISTSVCFPLFMSVLLLSKAAVVYSVDCTYSRKNFDRTEFYIIISNIWKRVLLTYFLNVAVLSGCLIGPLFVLGAINTVLFIIGCPPVLLLYPEFTVALIFAIFLGNAVILSNIIVVISILEDVSGIQALERTCDLVGGQYHVGLSMFIGSSIGMAFVEGLFEHRVRTISYGDGSSRLWEGPLLVVMHSFVLLIDSMMTTVFYFSCKSYSMVSTNDEIHPVPNAQ